jgi:hypothetical protein
LIPGRGRDFCPHHHVQTGSGAHPVFYLLDRRVLSPRVKWSECEADHSCPPSAAVKNAHVHDVVLNLLLPLSSISQYSILIHSAFSFVDRLVVSF